MVIRVVVADFEVVTEEEDRLDLEVEAEVRKIWSVAGPSPGDFAHTQFWRVRKATTY